MLYLLILLLEIIMYNYNHLFYFYTAAKFKSITKASVFLCISQPSLSSQIKSLEECLGLKLFSRNGRNVELTTKGETIYNICEDMFRGTSSLTNLLKNKTDEQVRLDIGVSNQIERPYIADVIGSLIHKSKQEDVPLIRMTNLERNVNSMEKYDLIINHKKESLKSAKIINLHLPIALIGSQKIIKKNGENFRNIKTFIKNYQGGIVLPTEEFNLRRETDEFLSKENYYPKIVFESDNMAANLRAIVEGVGIGFFPINYVLKEIKNKHLEYFMPKNGLWGHNIYLHYPPRNNDSKIINDLINIFLNSSHIKL